MNVERITQLADFIEKLPPKRFEISTWASPVDDHSKSLKTVGELKHNCGTCACIGGWAEALFNPDDHAFNMSGDSALLIENARQLLDLDDETADALFMPSASWDQVTREMAAATLRNLALTGEVVWPDV